MHVFSMLLALFALSLAQDMEITVDTTTDTPLMLAASIGDVDALRAELAKGSNVDEHNALGFTAAHQAVIYTHVSALEEVRLHETPVQFSLCNRQILKYAINIDALLSLADSRWGQLECARKRRMDASDVRLRCGTQNELNI